MRYLVDPQSLVFKAKGYIAGFNEMVKNEEIPQWDLLEIAMEVAEEWTNDWDEDQGFGSSDGTYMLKDFIDNVIWKYAGGKFDSKDILATGLGSISVTIPIVIGNKKR